MLIGLLFENNMSGLDELGKKIGKKYLWLVLSIFSKVNNSPFQYDRVYHNGPTFGTLFAFNLNFLISVIYEKLKVTNLIGWKKIFFFDLFKKKLNIQNKYIIYY